MFKRKQQLYAEQIAREIDAGIYQARVARNQSDLQSAGNGGAAGSGFYINRAIAMEPVGRETVTRCLGHLRAAKSRVVFNKTCMYKALYREIDRWSDEVNDWENRDTSFGGSGPRLFEKELSEVKARLRRQIEIDLHSFEERKPLSVNHPILSRVLDAVLAAVIAFGMSHIKAG